MNDTQNPGCLGFLLRLLGSTTLREATETLPAESFPYRVRDDFLSPAEQSFYHVVVSALGGRGIVCPKVGLSDVFFVVRPNENRSAFNRINQKHVDFVVCEPRSMKPLFGIELDDASHARADRQARDEFVGRVFEAAQLPLLRVPVQRSYNVQELAAQMEPFFSGLATLPTGETKADILPTGLPPKCPKCRVEMVARMSARGAFYGCPNYPKCRETIDGE